MLDDRQLKVDRFQILRFAQISSRDHYKVQRSLVEMHLNSGQIGPSRRHSQTQAKLGECCYSCDSTSWSGQKWNQGYCVWDQFELSEQS